MKSYTVIFSLSSITCFCLAATTRTPVIVVSDLQKQYQTLKADVESVLNALSNIVDRETQQSVSGIITYMENDIISVVEKTEQRIKSTIQPIAATNNNVTSCQKENIKRLEEIRKSIKTQMKDCSDIPKIAYKSVVEECHAMLAALGNVLNNCDDYPNNIMVQGCLMQYSSGEMVNETSVHEIKQKYANIRATHIKGSEIEAAVQCVTKAYGKLHAEVQSIKILVEKCVHKNAPYVAYML